MIKSIISFLIEFKKNKGAYIAISQVVSKLAMVGNSFFIVRILTKEEFGSVTLALSILSFLMPFINMGSQNGLLRFGSLASTNKAKDVLSYYNFNVGNKLNGITIFLFLIICLFFATKYKLLTTISWILSLRLVSLSFFFQIRIDYQIRNNNFGYAITDMMFNVCTLVLSFLLSLIFGIYGYVCSLSLSCIFFYCVLKKSLKFVAITNLPVSKKEFWKYSLGSSIANFLHTSISSIDTFMVGYFLSAINIAEYRISSIIPFNLFFIAQMFIVTDYPNFIKNFNNKKYFQTYIKNYFTIFFSLGIVLIAVFFLYGDFIIKLLFGSNYHATSAFYILILITVFSLLVLIPFGNITAALGLLKKNIYASVGAISIQLLTGLLLIPHYGILGAAIATGLAYIYSGFYNMIAVYFHFKKH
ncbi:Membrane protein involved in the export of O-antigen and teichoic acid [Apibacter mensalis]|uniref:Membrane protein involved in the export of O-antigen and teichoic acid n=1 Tax=Apibacter mensalis TaxID=1586267 RepID=A0A0X3AMV1_9FLAO|nr:oligosaccharide flippase family protein [Apibacter mensalis]CVK15711.1 Membrane protein involved in the export of O-antigen and teichoic acid [Apibacter mensalis]